MASFRSIISRNISQTSITNGSERLGSVLFEKRTLRVSMTISSAPRPHPLRLERHYPTAPFPIRIKRSHGSKNLDWIEPEHWR
jgi:hypothetical protein